MLESRRVDPLLILHPHGPEGAGENFVVIDRTPFKIGRRPDNDLQILRPDVSGFHAEFRHENGSWWILDHGSTNGSFVNGNRISKPISLRSGDLVHFGGKGYQIAPGIEPEQDFLSTKVVPDPGSKIKSIVDLHKVVTERKGYPVFQPIHDLQQRRCVGWESLGRAATKNGVGPGGLFDLAEKNGLARDLSSTFRNSAQDCVECGHCWPREKAYLFLNLHPAEIQAANFFELLDLLATGELSRRFELVVEIPESLVCNTTEMQVWVREIRSRNLLVAYDDFGRGQSRLPDLLDVPPDFIKLDRDLIAGLGAKRVKHDLVKAIVDASKKLGVQTLGEGIETTEELDACMDMGILYGQGYLLGRPVGAFDLFEIDQRTLPGRCPFVALDLLRKE